jgi:ammonium transporter, Amt family
VTTQEDSLVTRLHFHKRIPIIALLVVALFALTTGAILAGDPTGGEMADAIANSPDPAIAALAESMTFIWMIVAAALVFFMQAGFALVEAGFARSKNTVNILTKNFMDFCIGGLAFFFFGYALMYGASVAGLIGSNGFFLSGDFYDVVHARDWFFQMVFAATAATIVSGAMSERTQISAYLAYSFLISAIIYPISGHWIWGGGWLSQLGFHDFAGSGVVHALGGLVALTGAKLVGPRNGRFNKDGSVNQIPPHNVPFIVLGGLILFLGWFGFNGGSTLSGTDLRVSVVVTNTLLAGITGATVVLYVGLIRTGKANVLGAVNGSLAGLVGITAPAAVVAPWAAVIIGGLAGFVLIWGERFVERTLKIDDPVGAIAVHGICGLYGVLMVGVFADGTYAGVSGLITGNINQFLIQVLGAVVVAVWSLVTGFLMFSLLKFTMGLRASDEEQEMGLDVAEHGVEAYGPSVSTSALSPVSAD